MIQLPSFLKDSDALISNIKSIETNENLILMTMDVSALYSNIGHVLGLECIQYYLERDPEIPEVQQTFLLEALHFILNNNFFRYNKKCYHQRWGTAMGTRVAPAYVNLFMGRFEDLHILSNHQYRD